MIRCQCVIATTECSGTEHHCHRLPTDQEKLNKVKKLYSWKMWNSFFVNPVPVLETSLNCCSTGQLCSLRLQPRLMHRSLSPRRSLFRNIPPTESNGWWLYSPLPILLTKSNFFPSPQRGKNRKNWVNRKNGTVLRKVWRWQSISAEFDHLKFGATSWCYCARVHTLHIVRLQTKCVS